jgi:hypothetical protein
MQPILRFLQLLCENHNRELQVLVLIWVKAEKAAMIVCSWRDYQWRQQCSSKVGGNFCITEEKWKEKSFLHEKYQTHTQYHVCKSDLKPQWCHVVLCSGVVEEGLQTSGTVKVSNQTHVSSARILRYCVSLIETKLRQKGYFTTKSIPFFTWM